MHVINAKISVIMYIIIAIDLLKINMLFKY